jgi:hypothetical protein
MKPETDKFLDEVFAQNYKALTTAPYEPLGAIHFSGWKDIPNSIALRQFMKNCVYCSAKPSSSWWTLCSTITRNGCSTV